MDIITQPTKKNIILDATTLTSLMTCSRFYDFRMNRSLASVHGKSNNLECGSLVHKYLEIFHKSMIKGANRKDAHGFGMAAADLYIKSCPYCTNFKKQHSETCGMNVQIIDGNEARVCSNDGCILTPKCGHPVNEYPGLHNTPAESTTKPKRTGWKWVLDTCEQYFTYWSNKDHWISLEAEVVKKKIIYEDDNIRIMWKGKLDWVVDTNQGIYPVDHKTMSQDRPTSKLNNQFKGQCILMGTQTVFINKIGFQTSLKAEEKFIRVPVNYSANQLFEFYSQIVPYWCYHLLDIEESGYYAPNYTQCQGKFGPCMFHTICEDDDNLREENLRMHFVVAPKWDIENVEEF